MTKAVLFEKGGKKKFQKLPANSNSVSVVATADYLA